MDHHNLSQFFKTLQDRIKMILIHLDRDFEICPSHWITARKQEVMSLKTKQRAMRQIKVNLFNDFTTIYLDVSVITLK